MAQKRLTKKQQYWLSHLESWAKTPQSLSGYAKRCGFKAQTLYVAKGRLVAQGLWPARADDDGAVAKRFVRVVVPAGTQSSATCQVHLPNGTRVDVPVGEDGLAAVLRTVASL